MMPQDHQQQQHVPVPLVAQQQQSPTAATSPGGGIATSSTGGAAVYPLYDLVLDLPHPCASKACPGPFLITSPHSENEIMTELQKNLLQIVRFAFPEYDENSTDNTTATSFLNKYDVYAMQSKVASFLSFTFSMQLSTGVRVHGHVRRYLPPHLVARTRYDVGRRGERALCLLTRATGADYLYTSILKTVEAISAQQAALPATKMPHKGEPQKYFLHQLSRYHQHLSTLYGTKPGMERGKPLIAAIPCIEIGDDYHAIYKEIDVSRFIIPTTLLQQQPPAVQQQAQQQQQLQQHQQTLSAYGGSSILPLLRCVGVAHAIRILTALLCERRILLVSASPTRLAACSNSALAILSCGLLTWQHLYIPVLPPHLWQYLAAPYPYLIGILSSAVSKLDHTDGLGEVLIIHLDTNQLETRGIDPTKILQRLPDLFRSTSSSSGDFAQQLGNGVAAGGQAVSSSPDLLAQDLFDVLKMDKKILYGISSTNYAVNVVGETASKATAAVKNTFLKLRDKSRQYLSQRSTASESGNGGGYGSNPDITSPGGGGGTSDVDAADDSGDGNGMPTQENSMASDYIYTEGCHNEVSEEESRIAFTAFFLCLIGDMRWYLSARPDGGPPALDRAKFLQQKRAMGDGEGTAIFPLLTSFCQTQMLEEFAKARIEDIRTQQGQAVISASSSSSYSDIPLFIQCTSYHRQHHVDFHISNVKRIVRQIAESSPSGSRLTGMLQTNARRTAMALTSNKGYEGTGDTSQIIAQLVDQCRECTSILFDVMSVIWLRLRDCKGMQWKHALHALQILKNLLYHGPLAAITEAVDGLDKIRTLKYYENIRPVSVFQVRLAAATVYNLLVDRAKLFHIRRACIERRRQLQFPNTGVKLERETNARIGVPFRTLHAAMHPNAASGTVVKIPPKPAVAQTMIRDNHNTAPRQQQPQPQPVVEVDFFASTVPQQPQVSPAASTTDVLDVFGTLTVSGGTGPTAAKPSNPFGAVAVAPGGAPPSPTRIAQQPNNYPQPSSGPPLSYQQQQPHQALQVAQPMHQHGQAPPMFAIPQQPSTPPAPLQHQHQQQQMMMMQSQQQPPQQWPPHQGQPQQQQPQPFLQQHPAGGYGMPHPQQQHQMMVPSGNAGYGPPPTQYGHQQSQPRQNRPGMQFDPLAKK